jgi:dihydrofolate reductase
MATVVFAMNVSLDGYVDHDRFAPGPQLFRHWTDAVRGAAGSIYGRRLYEIMRYWDEDRPEWSDDERDFAIAWRETPKWVASRTLTEVGPNATLLDGDLAATVRALKGRRSGRIDVGGPRLAAALAELGLLDEYRLYYHPVVLGGGAPFFAGATPKLRLTRHGAMAEGVVRMTCVPA